MSRRNRMAALALLTALSAGAMYDAFYRGNVLAADQLREVQLTAHRGASTSAPENTMPAMEQRSIRWRILQSWMCRRRGMVCWYVP